jgi:hypothetical protein
MGDYCFERWCRYAPDTELAGGSKEGIRLDERDRGGHCRKMGRSTVAEEAEMSD